MPSRLLTVVLLMLAALTQLPCGTGSFRIHHAGKALCRGHRRASLREKTALPEPDVFDWLAIEDSDETFSSGSKVEKAGIPGDHGEDAANADASIPPRTCRPGESADRPLIYRLCKLVI